MSTLEREGNSPYDCRLVYDQTDVSQWGVCV